MRTASGVGRRLALFPWSALALAVAAMAFVVFTDGGRSVRLPDARGAEFAEAARKLGLGIEGVFLSGHRMTPDSDIYAALELERNNLLFMFDSVAARKRIEALPWVDRGSVTRVFPNTLKVLVSERQPYVIWRMSGQELLVDVGGRTLGPVATGARPRLPVVAGDGAGERASEIIGKLEETKSLAGRVKLARLVDGRRWSIELANGPTLHLPAQGLDAALAQIDKHHGQAVLLSPANSYVDLRVAGQLIVKARGGRG